jgi:hypothetical protein
VEYTPSADAHILISLSFILSFVMVLMGDRVSQAKGGA